MAADTKQEGQEDEGQENRATARDGQSADPRQSMIFLSPFSCPFRSRLYPRPSASSAAKCFLMWLQPKTAPGRGFPSRSIAVACGSLIIRLIADAAFPRQGADFETADWVL